MRTLLRWLAVLALLVVLGIVVALAVVYSGLYNVAADYPDRRPVHWFLSTTSTISIRHHAKGIRIPSLDSPRLVQTGFQQYRELCVQCHGAPGVSQADLARGLNPSPPEFVDTAGDWKPSELFWVIKHGVRMTGMPAWGVTHSDDQIWAMVAFTRRLPTMKPEEYQALDRKLPQLKMD